MRMLAIAVITLLAAYAADAQQLAPRNTDPITIHLAGTTFEDAIGFVSRHAGIEARFDSTATSERRNTRLTLNLEDVTLVEVLDALTRLSGLTYEVVDAKTILIYQLP
jgi:hypothetical protein